MNDMQAVHSEKKMHSVNRAAEQQPTVGRPTVGWTEPTEPGGRAAGFINEFLENCNSCGNCKQDCPFLEAYGTPEKIISENSENVFLCTNCRACNHFCPQGILPSEALLQKKHILIKDGAVSDDVKRAVNSALSFAVRGHRFPFSFYSSAETAFWPGCSLSGTNPEIVKKSIEILSRHLNKKVGLALDCCFDPAYQMGDLDAVKAASERILERLKKQKISSLITGCVNCKKIFSLYMPEIKVEHILEILPVKLLPETHSSELQTFFLHHPCPAYRFDNIREKAKSLLQIKTEKINETPYPYCCGLGGGSNSLSEEMSEKFTNKVIAESENRDIVTYCMGCKDRFLKKGKKAYHLLEFLPGIKPFESAVPSGKKWINRFFLSLRQRLKSKKLFFGILIFALIFIAAYLRQSGYISPESLLGFIQQYKIFAPMLFILLYSIGPSIFIPSLPLTLAAGFLWGPFWGVVFSITGATLGASIAFLLSRYIIGDVIKERFSYTRWQWLKERVEKHGWKAVAFSRIVPIFPFPVLNYLFGITPIPFLHYLWSTFVFMLPACIAYVAFGSSMGELILKGNVKGIVIGILIASAAMLLPLAFKPLARKVFSGKNGQ